MSASSAAIEISRNMDLFNVIPLALVAYRFNCRPLINFCDIFLRNNLDGVLAVGMKNDFEFDHRYSNGSFWWSERERLGGGIRVLFVVSWSFLLSFLGTAGKGRDDC